MILFSGCVERYSHKHYLSSFYSLFIIYFNFKWLAWHVPLLSSKSTRVTRTSVSPPLPPCAHNIQSVRLNHEWDLFYTFYQTKVWSFPLPCQSVSPLVLFCSIWIYFLFCYIYFLFLWVVRTDLLKIDKWISLSCYIDLSKFLHRFLLSC